jgi:hypothetical protein
MKKYLISLPCLIFLLIQACTPGENQALIGAKIYKHQGPYDQLFRQWNRMGINTAFCSEELISDPDFMREARSHKIRTLVIFPVFFNPDEIARSPHLAAIKRDGEVAAEEWVEFVCPSRADYREQLIAHARQVVREHRPDGISIDFIRHFVYWEKVYPDRDPSTLPLSCFDSVCLEHFQVESGLSIPEDLIGLPEKADWILEKHGEVWTDWRCELITGMVEAISGAAREEKPDILVNVHLVPWAEDDFDGAMRKVAGQDLPALAKLSDYLSPMTYAHMLKQPPPWVHEIVNDFHRQTGAAILPSIQVGQAYLDTPYGLEEFRQMMEAALAPPSKGVVLWSWEHLMAEPAKAELFKDIITAR